MLNFRVLKLASSFLFCSVISFLLLLKCEIIFLCCSPNSDLDLERLALPFSKNFWTRKLEFDESLLLPPGLSEDCPWLDLVLTSLVPLTLELLLWNKLFFLFMSVPSFSSSVMSWSKSKLSSSPIFDPCLRRRTPLPDCFKVEASSWQLLGRFVYILSAVCLQMSSCFSFHVTCCVCFIKNLWRYTHKSRFM